MVAKSNAVYLGRRNYDRKDIDGVIEEKVVYDFLVFDSESTNGLINCRLSTAIFNRDESPACFDELVPLEKCVVELDIRIYRSKTVMVITSVEAI